jgi:hypothetical protein
MLDPRVVFYPTRALNPKTMLYPKIVLNPKGAFKPGQSLKVGFIPDGIHNSMLALGTKPLMPYTHPPTYLLPTYSLTHPTYLLSIYLPPIS